MSSYLHTEIGERVEQSDFEFATSTSQRQTAQGLVTDVLLEAGRPQNYVLTGFESADGYGVLPGTTVTINGGKAIMGFRDQTVELGLIVSSGAASRNRDLNYLQDGTYGVYVRGVFVDDRFVNRLSWNPHATTPVETPRSTATRRTADWELAVELTSPGPEYLLLATAVKIGSTVTLSDKRPHYFEGEPGNAYAAVDGEWGGGTDRDADRATKGARSLRQALRGLQRQVQDIIGGSGWWSAIEQPLANAILRDGSRRMIGDLLPDVSNTYALGALTRLWSTIYTHGLQLWGEGRVLGSGSLKVGTAGNETMMVDPYAAIIPTLNVDNLQAYSGSAIHSLYPIAPTQVQVGTGGYAYQTPLSVQKDFSGCEFAAYSADPVNSKILLEGDTYLGYQNYGMLKLEPDTNDILLSKQINLPQGAVISSVIFRGVTPGTSSTKIGVAMVDHDVGSPASLMSSASGAGFPYVSFTASSGVRYYTLPIDQNQTVGNQKLIVKILAPSGAGDVYFFGVEVIYTLPVLRP